MSRARFLPAVGPFSPHTNQPFLVAPSPACPPPTLQALKAAFTALMTAESDKVSGAISSLVARLNQEAEGGRALSDKERLVLRLNSQYPNDVGVLSAFFLNQVCVWGGGGWQQPAGRAAGMWCDTNSTMWAAGRPSSWAGSRVANGRGWEGRKQWAGGRWWLDANSADGSGSQSQAARQQP